MIETGTLLQDRYLIEKKIGAGGMGAVYLAVDRRFGSPVAIKETFYKNDEFGDAFEREAHLLNSLHHPVLPHVSDYFTEGGGHFLVMQFIDGEDLSDILKRDGAFAVPDVMRWTNSLLDALDYLHSQEPPIIHRDIKPPNLKLTARGEVILLDFGLAKLNSDDAQNDRSVFGYSRKYSPLEQIQGTGTDARSDIFALGATAYHLLTGKPPVDALARASQIVAGNPDPLPLVSEIDDNIPVEIAEVLHSALKLNANERFISAKAMRQALEHIAVQLTAEQSEQTPEENLAPIAAAGEIKHFTVNESFPALEAFAAEAASVSPETEQDKILPLEESPAVNIESPAPTVFHESTAVGEMATKVSLRPKQPSRFSPAAVLVLLIFAGIAAGYFINRADSSNIAVETPKVEASPEKNPGVEQNAVADGSTLPETSVISLNEKDGRVKTKSSSIEKAAEKKESSAKGDTTENPPPVAQPENPRPNNPATPKARRSQPQENGEERSRVVESPAPVSDIETIFTGQPSENVKNRPQRDQMSDEELQQLRRQRREKRRARENGIPNPF